MQGQTIALPLEGEHCVHTLAILTDTHPRQTSIQNPALQWTEGT